MKTRLILVCLLCFGIASQAQQLTDRQQARPGTICVYVAPDDQWAGDGFPPKFDPRAKAGINPAFIIPLDGIDPGPGPLKRKIIDPEFLIPIEGIAPVVGDPHMKRKINTAYLIVHE